MSRIQSFLFAAVFCACGFAAASLAPLFGDDEPATDSASDKPVADAPETPAGEDPQAEWDKLSQRKIEIARRLRTLQGEFNQPGLAESRKKEIRDEFNRLVTEYRLEIESRMAELAEAVYAANPDDVEAAEAVMEAAYNNNRYQQALDVAQRLLQSGKKSKYDSYLAINIAGAASFSLNEFEQAQKYLKQAEEKKQLDDQHGGQFLEQIPQYLEFWKKEQELRAAEAEAEGDEQLPLVELTIGNGGQEAGKVVIELFENEAPNTVANFISIVEGEEKNYNGVKFHRVLPNFMAQTGDLEAAGKGELGYTIKCECYREDARKHFRGSLSMALKGKDTGDSQFYITHMPTYWLNEEVRPDSVHTVFGRVVKGMEVIDAVKRGDQIISAQVLFKRNHDYKPETVPIESKPEAKP